jgi:hypothetical protein
MTAPTNQPVVSSVPLYGPAFILGEVTNQYQPTTLTTWPVVIPSPLVGNEAIAGYAAFTQDGVTANRGVQLESLINFLGFFENQYFNEWDVGSLTGSDTLGNNFTVSVCSVGSIYVYNASPMSPVPGGVNVISSITVGTTPPGITVGMVFQGAPIPGVNWVDISSVCRVKFAQAVIGGGVLVSLLNK